MSRVTSDERRDVAKGLRYIANCCPPVQCLEQFRGALEDELFTGPGHANYTGIFIRLADLIDPTCHMSWEYGNGDDDTEEYMEEIAGTHEDTVACHCHECDEVFRYDRGIIPNYCPHCGARVVRDE